MKEQDQQICTLTNQCCGAMTDRSTIANLRIVFACFRNELAVQTLVNKQMAKHKLHPVIGFTDESEFSGKKGGLLVL